MRAATRSSCGRCASTSTATTTSCPSTDTAWEVGERALPRGAANELTSVPCAGPEACLVYQLMAGGSLEQRLRPKDGAAPLSWAQRCRIMCGVARYERTYHLIEKLGAPSE